MAKKLKMNAILRDPKVENPGRLRKGGMIPGIIYGKGADAVSIKIDSKEFFKAFHGHVAENVLIDLSFEDASDKSKTVIIKESQKNPIKDEFFHIDFIEIHAGEKLSTHIPIHIKGKSVGIVKGGIMEHSLRELHVECLPKDIPSEFIVDIKDLDAGQSVHVRDLKVAENVKVLTPADVIVVAIAIPNKAEEVATAEEGAEAEVATAEPEVIKKEREKEPKEA